MFFKVKEGLIFFNQRFKAKQTAFRISNNFSLDNVVINGPILSFETVCKWSQLIAQSLCRPSRFDKSTSLGMSLIVEVIGATVTSPK
jgi:hypothetical protein